MKKISILLLLALSCSVRADILSSCTNIGGESYQTTPPNYTITGTTTQICAACTNKTLEDVAALEASMSPGDAILFKAGETFILTVGADRPQLQAGVLYGRYGTGANPIINGNFVGLASFSGLVDVREDGVTWDGIDVTNSSAFTFFTNSASGVTVSNLTATNSTDGIFVFGSSSDILLDKVVATAGSGGANESITMTNVTNFVVSNVRSGGNGKAGIDVKGGSDGGEIFGSEFYSITNDPPFYIERASNIIAHDNWIHSSAGVFRVHSMFGVENLGDVSTHHNRNNEIYNSVIEDSQVQGHRWWIKSDVATGAGVSDDTMLNNVFRNNTIYNVNQENQSWQDGIEATDARSPTDPDDWVGNVIRDNIIWGTQNGDGIDLADGTSVGFTVEYNLFETGETGGADLGTNVISTGTVPLNDPANGDFTPIGAAVGASSTGGDVGADITWTCGLGGGGPGPPVLDDILTAKPEPYTIDTGETHYPDHLWVFSDATGGTTIDDEGGSVTDCDLTLSGPASGSDAFGKFWTFVDTESDIAQDATCTDPPTTVGTYCVIIDTGSAPVTSNDSPISWGDVSDAYKSFSIDLLPASGNSQAGICKGGGSCAGEANSGPWTATNDKLNMICARQSDTQNDLWMNNSGWQLQTIAGTSLWTGVDQVTVGALGRLADQNYLNAKVYLALAFKASKSDAEMTAIWNAGDPWTTLGIDPTAGGEPEVVPGINAKTYEAAQ